MNKRFVMLSSAALASVLLLSGCATDQLQRDIAEVRTMAQDAKASADRAQAGAEKAEAAMTQANAAMAKAEEASTAAEAAQSCCEDNRTRVDRMFRKAMNK